VNDPDDHGGGAKGFFVRTGLVLAGLSYGALGALAAGLLLGWRADEDDPSGAWLSATVGAGLEWLIVYGVAAVVFVVGAAHIVRGIRASFEKYFRCPEDVMRWLRPLSRAGLIARGVVFLIVAALIVRGGLAYNVDERPGLADALHAVQGYSFGWLVLLVIALGLVAFGLYSLAEARYRHVSPD
jgi:hypothetical protein